MEQRRFNSLLPSLKPGPLLKRHFKKNKKTSGSFFFAIPGNMQKKKKRANKKNETFQAFKKTIF